VRFGLALPHYDFSLPEAEEVSWSKVRDYAQSAEELGYHSLWVSDHLFFDISKYGGPSEPQNTLECWTTLAALSSVTGRVRLGSLVLCNDLRPPSLVAKMAATIDVLSEGRLDVGIGAGWYEPEYFAAGIPFERASVRIAKLEESVQIVKGMLSNESFSFEGKHFRVDEALNLPQPIQRPNPPVWVGGKGDRVVEVAGRHADGFNSAWAWKPEAYEERVRLLEQSAASARRDPRSIRRSVGLYSIVGDDERAVEKSFEKYLSVSLGASKDSSLSDWRVDKLVGTPEAISQTIKQFEALGVEEVILGFGLLPFQIAEEESLERFAKGVFPLVGERQGA
jgi:probable F420-dependent oxidoreductase